MHEQYQLERAKTVMDTINLMYVGTTRAEEKLFAFSFLPLEKLPKEGVKSKMKVSETPAENSLQNDSAKSLRDFIRSQSVSFVEDKQEGYTKYSLGSLSEIRPRKEVEENRLDVRKFRVNPNKPLDSLRKSKSGFDSPGLRESAMKGKVLHELLSHICAAEDVVPVVDFYAGNGWIENAKKEEYVSFFNTMVKQFPYAFPGIKSVLNERELADAEGNSYRPDRMVFDSNDHWKIIDFKTGREKQEHKKQVLQYAGLLFEAGMTVESSHIIYIDTESSKTFSVDV